MTVITLKVEKNIVIYQKRQYNIFYQRDKYLSSVESKDLVGVYLT